jgi:hypothetical protein
MTDIDKLWDGGQPDADAIAARAAACRCAGPSPLEARLADGSGALRAARRPQLGRHRPHVARGNHRLSAAGTPVRWPHG